MIRYNLNPFFLYVDIQLYHCSLLKQVFFPIELPWHLCQKSVGLKVGFTWSFNFFPLAYVSILILLPNCFNYCRFVVSFEIGMDVLCPPTFFFYFFFFCVLAILSPFHFHMNSRISLPIFVNKQAGILLWKYWICRSLWGILSFPVYESGVCFHLFRLFPSI